MPPRIHIYRNGYHGYLLPLMPSVVGAGFQLFNGNDELQERFDGPVRVAKRAAKKYIDENPDKFKEDE
jgi:hypothetical protein